MALTLDGTNGISSSGAISSSSNITATGTITTQSATGVIFSDSSNQGAAASPFSLKNRIINGDMVIDQRNNGASTTPTGAGSGTYTLDRWCYQAAQTGKATVQQNAGAVTPPTGFTNYAGITSTSAYSVLIGDYFHLYQAIEGFNIADLAWGTANAQTITISFWVRSSLTGTFGGCLRNSGTTRSYPFTYTITSANTWERKTITIPGDTSGTWLTNNGVGIYVGFGLGSGATFSGTAGAWGAGNFVQPSSTVSVVGTNGATWLITGVQLERNTTATPFEWIPFGLELMLCQRYFETSFNYGATIPSGTADGAVFSSGSIGGATTTFISTGYSYKVPKRATPTNVYYDLSGNASRCNREQFGSTSTNNQNLTVSYTSTNNATVFSTGTVNSSSISFHYTSSAEL